jgi:hypothetical protein
MLPLRVEGMYKKYIQTTYTSQIDKNIIRTENKNIKPIITNGMKKHGRWWCW